MGEPFCIIPGNTDLEQWWRGQRLIGVPHLGTENTGTKVSLESKMRGALGL